jgi:NAD(P)-dependent dehydrogenase (short-subunit alcohol dehydrogenase family)
MISGLARGHRCWRGGGDGAADRGAGGAGGRSEHHAPHGQSVWQLRAVNQVDDCYSNLTIYPKFTNDPVQVDLSNEAQVAGMVDAVMARDGRLDVLVNNAARSVSESMLMWGGMV